MMQQYPPDVRSRTISPDGYWSWDGVRWVPIGPAAAVRPFRSPRLRADLATAFLLILVSVNVLDMINSVVDLIAFGGRLGAGLEGTHMLWSSARNDLVGFSWLGVAFPGSVVFVSIWVYRAYANLESIGRRARMSAAMAVGWFFIPIANLWMPYRVIREVWDGTVGRPAGGLIAAWWTCWLAGSVVGSIQIPFSVSETSDAASHTAPLLMSFPSDLLFIAAALLLIRIIRTVTAAQEGLAIGPGKDVDAAPGVVRAAP